MPTKKICPKNRVRLVCPLIKKKLTCKRYETFCARSDSLEI